LNSGFVFPKQALYTLRQTSCLKEEILSLFLSFFFYGGTGA
jgi:hypothetical protein